MSLSRGPLLMAVLLGTAVQGGVVAVAVLAALAVVCPVRLPDAVLFVLFCAIVALNSPAVYHELRYLDRLLSRLRGRPPDDWQR